MAYMITEKCIKCSCCEIYCKNHGITEGDDRYIIDQEKCDCCGTCLEYCPIDDAIVKVPEAALVV